MNYEVLKNKIFYSKYMKSLHGKLSPVKGYVDAGSYARDNQRFVDVVAVNNDLDSNYCSVLALTQFLGLPPYGREGRAAIEEILGEQFNLAEINISRLMKISGEPIEERLKKDLRDLETGNIEGFSNEAKCVAFVKEAIEVYSLLNQDEKDKLGGSVLKTSMITGIRTGESGTVEKSNLQRKMALAVEGRKRDIDEKSKNSIKENMQKKVIESVLDEQGVIEKILGE